jgi:hypothetical protein
MIGEGRKRGVYRASLTAHEPFRRGDRFMLSLSDYVYFAFYLMLGGVATIAVFFAIPLAFISGGRAVNWILPFHEAVQARYSPYGSRLDCAAQMPERER